MHAWVVFCLHANVTAASLSMSVWMEAKRWLAPLSILLVIHPVRVSYPIPGAGEAYAEFCVRGVGWLAVDSVRCGWHEEWRAPKRCSGNRKHPSLPLLCPCVSLDNTPPALLHHHTHSKRVRMAMLPRTKRLDCPRHKQHALLPPAA